MKSLAIMAALGCGIVTIACARAGAAEAVQVAFMYSAFNEGAKSFMTEHDDAFEALAWDVTKFENIQAEELSARLDEFDIVIGSSVCNYENPQDFAPYAERWKAFLNRGGTVICTDASYVQLWGQWIGKIDPDFKMISGSCSEHLMPSPETKARAFDDDNAILRCPNDLRAAMRNKTNWGHMDGLGPGWQTPVHCYDEKPLLAYRSVGKGLLVVTSFFRMSGGRPESLGRGLLENALICAQARRGGVEMARLTYGEAAPGPNRVVLELRNISEAAVDLTASISVQHGDDAARSSDATGNLAPGATREFELPYETTARGAHSVSVTIASEADGAFFNSRNSLVIPEAITIDLSTRHHYPHYVALKPKVRLAPDPPLDLRDTRLTLQLVSEAAKGKRIVIRSPEDVLDAKLPLANLRPGEYELVARLTGKGGHDYHASAPIVLHPEPWVRIEPDNTCFVNGEPFFPLGMYMVTWQYEKEQVLECVRNLAEAGFNTAHLGCKDFDDFREILDEAERLDIKVIVEGLRDMETVERFKDHPAILAWNPGDEPDGAGVAPSEVSRRIDVIKAIDPNRVTYTTLCIPDQYHTYAPVTEVFSLDPYPVNRGTHNLPYVGECVDRARDSVKGTKPLWVVPQCFGGYSSWDVPTPIQERAMTYQALIHGANGLIWYTYQDGKFNVLEHPELWAEMQKLVAEVKALSPVLLGPANDGVQFRAGEDDIIHGLAARDGRDLYVITVNAENEDAGTVELDVAGLPDSGEAEVLFEERSVDVVDGKIVDEYGPGASHVYRIGRARARQAGENQNRGVAMRYGLRHDPMTYVEGDEALQGAMTRRTIGRAKPGDPEILMGRIEEILAAQNEDGTLSDDERHRYQFTASSLIELAELGVDPEREEVTRAVDVVLREKDDESADELGIYTIRALCLLGMGDHAEVRRGLQGVVDRQDQWNGPYEGCPWTPIEHLQTLWIGREVLDATELVESALTWIAEGMNEAGCLSYKDPWGFLRIASYVDSPVAKRIVQRQVPMILRGQQEDGGWGDRTPVVMRALVTHGLLEGLLELPPLPPDWTVVREIPAPEGQLYSLAHDGENLWVRECEADEALCLSTDDGRVLKRVKLPEGKNGGLGWWDGGLGVTQSDPKRLVRLDPDTGEVTREIGLDAMEWINGFTQANGEVWVGDGFMGNVLRIDSADPAKTRPYILGGPCPIGLAAEPDGVWHFDVWAPAMVKTSLEGKTEHDGILVDWGEKPFDGNVNGLAHDGEDLWALDAAGKRVCVIRRRR